MAWNDNLNNKELDSRLARATYPCYLIASGPERTYRTTYRHEHEGAFASGIVNNADEARKMVTGAGYPGWFREMKLIAVFIKTEQMLDEWEREELKEKELPFVPELMEVEL